MIASLHVSVVLVTRSSLDHLFLLVSEWRRDSSSKAASAYESSSPSSSPRDGSDVLRSCAYGRCPAAAAAAWWDPVSSKFSRIRYEFGLFWIGYYALFRPQLGSGIHPSSLYIRKTSFSI